MRSMRMTGSCRTAEHSRVSTSSMASLSPACCHVVVTPRALTWPYGGPITIAFALGLGTISTSIVVRICAHEDEHASAAASNADPGDRIASDLDRGAELAPDLRGDGRHELVARLLGDPVPAFRHEIEVPCVRVRGHPDLPGCAVRVDHEPHAVGERDRQHVARELHVHRFVLEVPE